MRLPIGLCNAVALLEPFKAKYPDVSYADLFQMASACAIEVKLERSKPDNPLPFELRGHRLTSDLTPQSMPTPTMI
jgi:hypothetical protein